MDEIDRLRAGSMERKDLRDIATTIYAELGGEIIRGREFRIDDAESIARAVVTRLRQRRRLVKP